MCMAPTCSDRCCSDNYQTRANGFHRRVFAAALICLLILGCTAADSTEKPGTWEVILTGVDFRWQITDPGIDGRLGTADDLTTSPPLRLIAGTRTRITLLSRDYLYMFAVPDADVRQIAVPDLRYSVDIHTGSARETTFLGDQFCGFAHAELSGAILVQDWSEYRQWQHKVAESSSRRETAR